MTTPSCCDLLDPSTNVFSAAAGSVVAIEGNAVPIIFSLDGDVNAINNLKAICTSVGVQEQAGHQFMHTLRNTVYLYVFTERVGEIVVNGLAFPGSCDMKLGPQDDATWGPQYSFCDITTMTGFERVVQYYDCNRVTARAQPVNINIGVSIVWKAFLIGMKVDIANAETGIAQFSYRFAMLPHNTDSDANCFELIP